MIQFDSMFSAAKPIITLTTDFGLGDPYVGAMKGVILNIAAEATVVDITHLIQSHDIVEAALVLRSSYSFFPPGTIHVIVVDPGVGSCRLPILLATEKYFFVGPDNGVLSPVHRLAQQAEIFHLTATEYFLKPVSNTFHGRDIFSAVAGWLSKGIDPGRLGKRISNLQELKLPLVRKIDENRMIGTILRADRFGNLITNVSLQDLSLPGKDLSPFVVRIADKTIVQLCSSYAEAPPGEFFAIWGSLGLLEISVNQGSAAEILQASKAQEFVVELRP